ncbi:hypothetical protein BDZ89DRAFT_567075 [Hymenopellis radicata]|nr:hypothetical protein BDZ89DRAFT_567075 [Hymenopellis radicata]
MPLPSTPNLAGCASRQRGRRPQRRPTVTLASDYDTSEDDKSSGEDNDELDDNAVLINENTPITASDSRGYEDRMSAGGLQQRCEAASLSSSPMTPSSWEGNGNGCGCVLFACRPCLRLPIAGGSNIASGRATRSVRSLSKHSFSSARVFSLLKVTNTSSRTHRPSCVVVSRTHVRWSPKEDKFAVASGAWAVSV